MLAFTLTVGGVFAAFHYAQSEATSDNKNISAELEEFVYGDYPPGFTQEMQAILEVVEKDTTYGLNASGFSVGMKKAIVYTQLFGRAGYGYVGTMDKTYGNDLYGKDVVESVSIIVSFPKKIDEVQTIYMYLVKKSKAELAAIAENDTINNVYRATFIKDDSTANDWDLRKLADGTIDVIKGYSLVKNYEGQTDGAKTFGFYNKTEIWQAE